MLVHSLDLVLPLRSCSFSARCGDDDVCSLEIQAKKKPVTPLQQVNPKVRGTRVSQQVSPQGLAPLVTPEVMSGAQKPFIDVSSGDPHTAGMKPISFVRQVLAACLHPLLLKDESLPADVRARAQKLLENCDGESVDSSGLPHIRRSIAEFISRRDAGVPSHPKHIFVSTGSQMALMVVLKLLATGDGETQAGVLTPTPVPHTLPMLLDAAGVTPVSYQLTEDRGWAVELEELHRALKTARGCCRPRAIYICNPGNPTGHVQDRKSMEEVIQLAAAEKLLLLVDEVYQDSVYRQDAEFISYKKVLFEMSQDVSDTVELVSFHSVSNAEIGECGLRAGYMEAVNMDPQVLLLVNTLLCTDICAPVTGQLALDLMVNPPNPGDASYDTYTQEILLRRAALSQNAQWAQAFLSALPGMTCQPAMGGIYLYPRLHLPPEALEDAEVGADVWYCQRLLEEEGVLVGAGCQNGGPDGHLRISVLVPPRVLEEALSRLSAFHHRLWADV